jgi:hypothetical protein
MATTEEIMTALGEAVFAAQGFEINVGSLLLFLTAETGNRAQFQNPDGVRDEAAVRAFIEQVDRLTLGQLKGKLEALGVLDQETINQISLLNEKRKRLVHYFVPDYIDRMDTAEGRQGVLIELHQIQATLMEAWQNLQAFLAQKSLESQVQR